MIKLNIKLLAFTGAPASIYQKAAERITRMVPADRYQLVDSDPDVLLFLSGGSEQLATGLVKPGQFYLLIGSQHDNSWASATEVKAWLNSRNIASILLNEEHAQAPEVIRDFLRVKQGLASLRGKRLGLIGTVSDWLISSAVDPDILRAKLGIELIRVPWDQLGHFRLSEPSGAFLDFYSDKKESDLTETARVSQLLSDAIQKWDLDALTVECFPMVQKDGVTACLPLARFNNEGIPAGCEGDITAIAGMMLCRELTGTIPWMANVNKIAEEGCLFSHCTIAPGLLTGFSVTTHFETGKGTAIAGQFKGDRITIFRFDSTLERAFIASATITGRPGYDTACRTQIEVQLSEADRKSLREHPLGNHHLIFPGDCSGLLEIACTLLGIRKVNQI